MARKKSTSKGGFDMKSAVKKTVPVLIVLALLAGGGFFAKNLMTGKPETGFQKGMGYVTWSKNGYNTDNSDESIVLVKELGSNWIAIHTTWYQTTCWSGDIMPTEKTPSDEALTRAIRTAHESGMKVMLKPHLVLIDKTDGSWRGEIGCTLEADWDKWFVKYTNFILHYVEIANKEGVEMMCIGTELSSSATAKGYLWNDLIKTVRANYKGLLTYAAHWY